MKRLLKNGQTSVVLRFFLQDSTSTVGAGKTGLGIASAGLIIATLASNEATPTVYTAAGSTIETIAALGTYAAPTATKCRFKEVDATNCPGLYEVQIADARFAVSNARTLLISIIATGIAPVYAECELVAVDLLDAAGLGLSRLDASVSSRAAIADYTTARAAKLDNLDAAVSTRLATAGYTAPDNTSIAAIAARIGAFTGTGLNTILGMFRALMRKTEALTPSDVGGTYDNTTDSLEAQQETNAAAFADVSLGLDGSVAWAHTVYQNDGTTPIPGASVYVTANVDGSGRRSRTRVTDDLGQVVFQLNPGTYYFWHSHPSWTFGDDPDTEAVS